MMGGRAGAGRALVGRRNIPAAHPQRVSLARSSRQPHHPDAGPTNPQPDHPTGC